jgi:hypothetical protein
VTQTTVSHRVASDAVQEATGPVRASIAGLRTETRYLNRSTTEYGCHAEKATAESRRQAYVHVL